MARTLTAALASAHAVRSPQARVTATIANRGQNAGAPALNWSQLVAPPASASTLPAAGLSFASAFIRFVAATGNLKYQTITDPTDADQWESNAYTTAQSLTAFALAAFRQGDEQGILFYISGGDVSHIYTDDSGDTWSSPVTNYNGGDAASDVCCNRTHADHAESNTMVYGFSTLNSGTYAAYFSLGGTPVKYADGWRAAGVYVDPADNTYIYAIVFREPNNGPSRLRMLRFDGTNYDQPYDMDQSQAGLFGLQLAAYKFCPSLDDSAMLGVAVECAYMGGNYEGIAGLFKNEELQADEPIMFPDVPTWNDLVRSFVVKDAINDGDYYYFGDTFVYRGQTPSVTSETLYPITYIYDDHELECLFPQDTPAIHPGQILTLTRSLAYDSVASGSEDLSFYVVRVSRSRRHTTVFALDPVGFLGTARCRRPCVLNDGTAEGLAQVIRRLCARFGLSVACDDSGLESADVMPITLQPSESLRGAFFRVTSQSNAWLVPSNDGTFSVTLINPGTSESGDYDDTAHTYPDGEWTLADAAEISDYRRLAFSYVLGTYSTDPSDGSYVGMANGPVVPNTRPLSYSLTNTRYNTDERVESAAAAEASRQRKLTIDAIIEARVNLALELYDMVSVTEVSLGWSAKLFRVRRIREEWSQHRLTQTIFLGEES